MTQLPEANAIVRDVVKEFLWLNIKTDIPVVNVGLPNLHIKNSQRRSIRNNNHNNNNNINLQMLLFPSLSCGLLRVQKQDRMIQHSVLIWPIF
jgi:hypothetical protein